MTERRPRGPEYRRASGLLLAGSACLAVLIAGCSNGGHGGTAQSASTAPVSPPSVTPASPSPTTDVRAEALGQYRAFWTRLTPASRAPAANRAAMLSPFATNPELRSLLEGMARGDRAGTVFYGQDVPRPVVAQLSVPQGLAVIRDCQDSSKSGNADRASGRRLTVGVARHLVIATMHLVDGTWRVAFVSYKQAKC
jgi:hypothetical protein